jgi:hypothetical protein
MKASMVRVNSTSPFFTYDRHHRTGPGYITEPGFLVTSTITVPRVGCRVTFTIARSKTVDAEVTEVIPNRNVAVLRYDPKDAPEVKPIRLGQPKAWSLILGWTNNLAPYLGWTSDSFALAYPTLQDGASYLFSANYFDLNLPGYYPAFTNASCTKLIGLSLPVAVDEDGDDENGTTPATVLRQAIEYCKGTKYRFVPAIFVEISKARLPDIPAPFDTKQCHRYSRESYIQVDSADPDTGLVPNDIIVAVKGVVPSMLDMFTETEVPFTVIREGKVESIKVRTFDAKEFQSNTVITCYGMIVQQVPRQLRIRKKNAPTGLHICDTKQGSLARSWHIPVPSYLTSFNDVNMSTIGDLEKQLKAVSQSPQGELPRPFKDFRSLTMSRHDIIHDREVHRTHYGEVRQT